jgi:biotin carboxyl carrier protein
MNVVAPMVGKVVSINVNPGDKVKANDEVATIEAMKMYISIYAPGDGTVKEIKVAPGDAVNNDTVIMTLE